MKAKELLAIYEGECQQMGEKQATIKLVQRFGAEISAIADKRKVKSRGAYLAILRELNDKWNALCHLDKRKRFREDGFIEFIKRWLADHMPFGYLMIKDDLESMRR